jgi:hypothetical protein
MSANVQQHSFALRFRDFAAVDTAAGVVRGVSVITVGTAKGHGVMIDATTLAQVKACAEGYKGGLKVKMTHEGDAGDIIGYLTGFRIEGEQLIADLNLLKSSRFREYVLEIAQAIPDTFGLSISFSGPVEDKDGADYARCLEIYSADLVAEPAANPSGLFDAGPIGTSATAPAPQSQPNQSTQMDENKVKEIVEGALKAALDPLSARLSKLETPPAAPVVTDEDKEKAMQAKMENVAELAAKNALQAFAATLGTPPAPASAESQKPATQKFEDVVKAHADYAKNKAAAIKATVLSHPKEYADYNQRLRTGEVVMF